MRVECFICNKDFANKNSLYQHRNKYHKNMDKNSNERIVLLPHPAFKNDAPKFGESSNYDNLSKLSEDNTKINKRSHIREESDSDSEPIIVTANP